MTYKRQTHPEVFRKSPTTHQVSYIFTRFGSLPNFVLCSFFTVSVWLFHHFRFTEIHRPALLAVEQSYTLRDMRGQNELNDGLKLRSCVIRPWAIDDAAAIQRYANNRNIWINLRDIFPHPYRLEDAHVFLSFVLKEDRRTTFAIATESEAIGCLSLRLGSDVHRKTAELGYWLGEPFWGRGIMTEAVAEVTGWAFDAFDLQRIFAQPFADNTASIRVLEKAGFVCEGRLRANVFKDGKVIDSFMYACVREN